MTNPTFKPEIIAACDAYEAEEGGYDGMVAAIDAFLQARPNVEESKTTQLTARACPLLEALQSLCEAADASDDCQYGTLSTSFVRDIARAAIAKIST
jgi:hypothetical protein